jgi:hypothetical protein
MLKQIDANTIEMTNKAGGKVTFTARYTVSPDGRTMSVEGHSSTGGVEMYVARKQ